MEKYITGIAPLRWHFWIEWEKRRATERLLSADKNHEWREWPDTVSWRRDYEFLHWCETCYKKERVTTAPSWSTIKFQLRGWCDRAAEAIKARGGCPDDLQWLVAVRDMEYEKLSFTGATNGVWDSDHGGES